MRSSSDPNFNNSYDISLIRIWLISNRLRLIYNKANYELGESETHRIRGHDSLKYIILACGVDGATSNYKALSKIGKSIANAANRIKSVKNIAIPLLGTGAGGLKHTESLDSLFVSFYNTARNDIELTFCIQKVMTINL